MRTTHKILRTVMLVMPTLLSIHPGVSDASEDGQDRPPWRVQRHYVPQDRPEQWPRKVNERYLPMPAEEFERRLAQLRGPANSTTAPPAARLISAYYQAEIAEIDALRGEAVWEFEHRDKQREIVILNGCQLALSDCHWVHGDGRGDERAVVGNDQHGRLAVVVNRSGKLRCRWSLRGDKKSAGESNFTLPLPACPINTLQLLLPDNMTPSADHGVVSDLEPTKKGQRRWQIEWGGHRQPTLRIVKQDLQRQDQAKPTVSQSLTYELSPRGMELAAELKLDAIGAALRQIKLQVDHRLTIVQVRLGDTELRISPSAQNERAKSTTASPELTLELPEPIQGSGHVLHVRAIASLLVDSPWQLPLIQLPDVHWQQGSAKLIVPEPMVIDELSTEGCRQKDAEPLSEGALGEVIHIELFDQQSKIGVVLSRLPGKVRSTQGTSVFLRANEGIGRCQAEFIADKGEQFSLEAEISPQWILDNVESVPPGAVADWSQQPARNRPGKLTVQLSGPLSPNHHLGLLITGRRRSAPLRDTLRVGDLAMLRFINCTTTRRLIHVQASEAHQLQLLGAEELTRLDPAKLSSADAAQLMENPSGLMFVADENARNLAVSLAAKIPQFEADIQSEALVSDDRLSETYRFSITPQSREVTRVNVRFSQPRAEPVTWSIEGDPDVEPSARKWQEPELAAQGWTNGEAWEVSLPVAKASPFVVIAARQSALRDDLPLALGSVIDAESQRGTIQVVSTGNLLPELRSRRIKAIPVEPSPADRYPVSLAAFRYDPEQDTLLAAEPALVIAARSEFATTKAAWVWHAQLQSRYSRSGAEHMLTCNVENSGRGEIKFQAPPGAQLRGVWVDAQPMIDPATLNPESWKVNLPPAAKFVTVVLHWNEGRPLPTAISSYAAPWPACEVPVLLRDWIVWLPPGFALSDAQFGSVPCVDIPWASRLFGPLARTREKRMAITTSVPRDENFGEEARSMAPAETEEPPSTSRLPTPWKSTDRNSWSVQGWTSYRFNRLSASAGRIWVADESSLCAWAWSLFVLSIAARWWIGSRSPLLDIAILAAAALVALLMPTPWTPLSAAIWLGLAAGLLIVCLRNMWPSESIDADPPTAAASQAPHVVAATPVVGLLLAIALNGLVQADEPQHVAPRESSVQPPTRTQHVLIPVDQNGRPTGGLYFLAESFHDALRRATASPDEGSPQYLITQATYRVDLARDANSGELNSGDWQAGFQVESFADHAMVRLPLGADGAALVPDGVKLNGQSATFRWDDASRRLEIELAEPRRHQIEVLLRPVPRRNGFDFTVPPVTAALVDRNRLSGTPVEISSALGCRDDSLMSDQTAPADQSQRLRVRLGPAERLVLRQPTVASTNSRPTSAFEVDELYWLNVRPGAVVVDAQFRVTVRSGRLQQLRLLADPRFRPLPPADAIANDDENLVDDVKRLSTDSNIVQIDLSRPIVGQATVKVSFELAGASGIGRWQPPMLAVVGPTSTRRWWAATVDSALEVNLAQQVAVDTIPPQQFAALWGGDPQPQIAWQSTATPSQWSVATRPREPKITSRSQMLLLAGQREMSVRFATALAVSNGPVFQYRVKVPAQMEIDDIFIDEQNANLPVQWSRRQADVVMVRLPAAATSDQRLSIVGHMPLPADGKFTLPTLSVDGSLAAGCRAIVMRRPEVLVGVADAAQWQTVAEDDQDRALAEVQRDGRLESAYFSGARLVSVLEGRHELQGPILRIQRNQPQLRTVQLTTVSRTAEAWRATVDLDLRIGRGVVDTLRLDIPPSWVGPFEIAPAMPFSLHEAPAENRRQIILRPEVPLQANVRVRITSPLTLAGGRPSAPLVRLLDASRQSVSFFLLPQRLDNQQLSWDTRGMILRPLPEEAAAMMTKSESYRAYQLMAERGRATLRSVERSSEKPQVRLADVWVSWDRDGNGFGVAAFDLETAGATSCDLELPAGGRLIHAQLDSAPAQVAASGHGRWNVWLGDNKLPHRLEVVFTGPTTVGDGNTTILPAPTLLGLPVERTLWTVVAPAWAGATELPAGTPTPPLRHARLRLEGALTLLDSAVSLSLDEPKDDVTRWYTTWARRFAASRAAMRSANSASPADDQARTTETELTDIDQEHAQLVRRLGATALSSSTSSAPSVASEWLHLAEQLPAIDRSPDYAAIRGQSEPLAIRYPRAEFDGHRSRWVAAALIVLLMVAILLAARRGWTFLDALADKPHLWGLLAAAVWWCWLTPAWLGVVILAATAYCGWLRTEQPVSNAESAA